MKTFRYKGDPGRYYPDLGYTAGPKGDGYDGLELEADRNPDPERFTERATPRTEDTTPDNPASETE